MFNGPEYNKACETASKANAKRKMRDDSCKQPGAAGGVVKDRVSDKADGEWHKEILSTGTWDTHSARVAMQLDKIMKDANLEVDKCNAANRQRMHNVLNDKMHKGCTMHVRLKQSPHLCLGASPRLEVYVRQGLSLIHI